MWNLDRPETYPLISEAVVKIRRHPDIGNGLKSPWRVTRTMVCMAYDPSLTHWIQTKEGRLRLTALDARP